MFELRELTLLSVGLRILAAVILGGIIGLERGLRNRPAGLRTNMLVCIGACMVMITNQYIHQIYGTGDPVRMGAQVVSGIGFLGAGTIIVTAHNRIKGLTTAASLWAAACVGLAIGIGFYEVAVIGCGAIFLVLTLLHVWDERMHRSTRSIEVYIELEPDVSLGEFLSRAREAGIIFSALQTERSVPYGSIAFFASAKGRKRTHQDILLNNIRSLKGVRFSEAL